ncbi:FAD-containing oxidoreductase [Aminobacter aganoensis]|uniref:Pyruvate/2-oxoglutarate dehydrogenase complex dihydrolipoamide dehydrogenase (E3) component n=1 Tax=Aminobacter aganoensis TaxID=83264 RepID=A0A7X0KNP6_9HYPH|nr:FAD-containing oxidoreductase [Aminobacter aganoensis]MBB6357388.1 pyruvate/2-oxoglutarate dehydrogenase complex dihydrolipoamide dehydrogenase (E3) component [Aminobacter aganoensis]
MSAAKKFDAIIIGCGQAGPPLAGRLTAAGQTVALIERKLVGGTCVNTGCKPTKTMVASAYAAHLARTGADYGVSTGKVSVDMKAVKARKDKVTLDSRASLEDWIAGMKGCTLYRGHASFEGPHEVRVGDDLLHGERIFINVGGRANIPDMPGIGDIEYLTNTSMMEVDCLPRHLVVVGGSYIGLEFAQMYRRFGSDVTVVEKGPRLISREDEEVSEAVKGILEHEGIKLRLNAECISFAAHPDGVTVGVDCTSGDRAVTGSHVLLAIGRKPNTDDLGLDKAGVHTDKRGYIEVDDHLRTNVPHIWAMGDCNGKGAFTHTAYNDFEIVAANLLDNDKRKVTDRIEAYALYIDPPLGRAGMTEAAARKSGRKVLVGQRPMTRVGRAVEKGETLQRAMHIHPTVSELLPTIAQELKPLA